MNPWAVALGEVKAPALDLPSRRHVLADDVDPTTLLLTSQEPKPAPEPKRRGRPPKAVPQVAAPPAPVQIRSIPPTPPGPTVYRVPAPTPKPAMTYAQAMVVRERARNRQPVMAADLIEANRIVQETRRRALPPEESYS